MSNLILAKEFGIGFCQNATKAKPPSFPTFFMSHLNYDGNLDDLHQIPKLFDGQKSFFIPRWEDYIFVAQNGKDPRFALFCDWILKLPLVYDIVMPNGVKYVIVNGAIGDERKSSDIKLKRNNLDWHKQYDGRIGYIVSCHEKPTIEVLYFNFSASVLMNNGIRRIDERKIGD